MDKNLKRSTMINQKDIVITGIQAWDIGIGSNCINIAKEMSKNHRVLYVNPPLSRKEIYNGPETAEIKFRIECLKEQRNPVQKIHKNLWVFNPPMIAESVSWMPHFMFKYWNKINSEKLAGKIAIALESIGFKDYVLFTDSDMYRSQHLKSYLKPSGFIYYSRDNLMTVPYWFKHGKYLEPKLMAQADVVVANSPFLADKASSFNLKSFYVGQGCDIDDFLPRNEDEILYDFGNMKRKKVGYVGLLSQRRLSISAIGYIAKARNDWDIILIGPQEPCFLNCDLHDLPNVHFIGKINEEEIGRYVRSFDVCINPQVVNELTKGNYPRKIDEYLAAGKPVVATYTPTMEVFKNYCHLARKEEDYPYLIEKALKENSSVLEESRIQFAQTHSWSNSVEAIWEAYEKSKVFNH